MVHALRIAGAKQVLVTLWPVLDKPTAAFMETFYSLWLTDRDQDPAAALDATKELFRHHNNPAYRRPLVWAPFILIG
jgi:CHAT domain-containing protein